MRSEESLQVYRQRVNVVIDHIKSHLTDQLSVSELAQVAHFSPYHFHRIFGVIVGEPLQTFVRRVRLETAVFRILHGPKTSLTRVALESGFASSSDFSRVFKQVYGFSPRQLSRERLLQESKIRQELLPNAGYGFGELPAGGNPDLFEVRLVDRPTQRFVYERVIGAFDPHLIREAFDRLVGWGQTHGLLPDAQLIGMTKDTPDVTPMPKYQFDWCLVLPPGRGSYGPANIGTVSANRFASVRCQGDVYHEERAWRYLFQTWLPLSGYEPADGALMEVYHRTPLETGWDSYDIDCCVPVRSLTR